MGKRSGLCIKKFNELLFLSISTPDSDSEAATVLPCKRSHGIVISNYNLAESASTLLAVYEDFDLPVPKVVPPHDRIGASF